MSYDLYLLELPSDDLNEARSRLEERLARARGESTPPELKEGAAEALMNADSRFQPFKKDYQAIAEFEGISVEEARKRYDELELNGPGEEKLAQFVFDNGYIAVHWYSGTTPEEMLNYLEILCRETGYAVFDPQASTVTRY